VKSVRIDRLIASTALGLVLVLSVTPGQAQPTDQQIDAAIPIPDTTLPPPLTAKDIGVKDIGAKDIGPTTQSIPAAPSAVKPAAQAAAPQAKPEPQAAPKPENQDATAPKAMPPAAAPAKAASAPEATPPSPNGDLAVADKLRELVEGKIGRFISRKPDREGAVAYYKSHDFKPLWVSNGAANARAKAAIAYLAQVDTVGLTPSEYPAPDFNKATTAEALAQDELKLTESVLTYARHAQIGQIHFSRVGNDINFKLDPPNPESVLAKLADSADTAAALDSYNPPQAGFKALRKKLAELRAGTLSKPDQANDKPKQVRVPAGPILRPGMRDARVIALRKRLNVPGDKNNPLYDTAVLEAVKAFQMQADLGVDGMLGPNTLRALNGTHEAPHAPANPIDTILVNMERWRWLPRKLGNSDNDYVIVNVPDYTLTLMHDGKPLWKTKIVVGKPGKATPMISAEMKYITVNPTWNVPPSIIENEYLPALQEDPNALDRIGLKLEQRPDGTVRIYQPPGADNALGRLRFNFPNKFLVYQHDTPDKYLFKRAKRAYSHGCMRVQDPVEYAVKLLSLELPKEHYTRARIESMYGDNEININFPNPIPVHLTYQTAFVDQNGKLQFRQDVYGRDARMIAILHGGDMKVADIAVPRPPNTSAKPVRMPVGMYSRYSDGYGRDYNNGPSFFDFLFGGGREYAPPPPRYYRPRGFIGPRANDNGRYMWR
jgi:murein L,D-transpeptidase YcbB/YkuD